MNKAIIGVFAVLGVAVAAGAGYRTGTRHTPPAVTAASASPSGKGGAQGAGSGPAITVEAIKVITAALPQALTAVGSLRSDESVVVRPEVAGRVAAILFKEGQRVPKGAPLVRLDTAINDADVKQARANYTLAKSKYERAQDLQKQNFISAQARDEAENNFKVADAALSLAEAKFAKTEIKAPFTGVIGLRSVSVGDYVKEGADIVNLEAIDPLKVDFRVPELYFSQIRAGQPLEVTLDAHPGRTFTGQVYAVNPLVDAAGRSVVVRAVVRNPDTSLRPGMFARVRLITRDEREALVVPEQALVPQGQDQYIFRVVDGRAQRMKVEVGQRRDGKAEIVKGLEPQDIVVTAGQLKIRDGAEVKVARVDNASARTAAVRGTASAPARRKDSGADEPDKGAPPAPAKADATSSRGARS
jgi:membrane fusion protein (multidrug efflux system)